MSEEITIASARALDCAHEPRAWEWAEREAPAIEAHWARLSSANPHLYDGRVLLMHRGALDGDVFRGAWLETRFSRFIGWRDAGMPDAGVRNGFAMAALRGADGAFVLGEMGAHTANAGRVYFPAGTPDPADVVGTRVDLAASLARELAEETGCAAQDLDAEEGWRIVFAGGRVACMKILWARETAAALKARIEAWLATQERPELAAMRIARGPEDFDAERMPPFIRAFLAEQFARRR